MPNALEVAHMAAVAQERSMASRAAILRESSSSDGRGGMTKTWATVQSNIPCRIDIVTIDEPQAGALGVASRFKIAFPAGTDIRFSDRISIGGVTYGVYGLPYQKTNEITRDVEARKI